jgi:hypothetical protein
MQTMTTIGLDIAKVSSVTQQYAGYWGIAAAPFGKSSKIVSSRPNSLLWNGPTRWGICCSHQPGGSAASWTQHWYRREAPLQLPDRTKGRPPLEGRFLGVVLRKRLKVSFRITPPVT